MSNRFDFGKFAMDADDLHDLQRKLMDAHKQEAARRGLKFWKLGQPEDYGVLSKVDGGELGSELNVRTGAVEHEYRRIA